jgi:NADH dehydrogenase (ubiquinone) Fe-S protein 1
MLRQSLARSALRASRQSCNASRTFATSSRKQAEVQLTIGKTHWVCGLCGLTEC